MKQNRKAIIIVIIILTGYSILVSLFAASRANKESEKEKVKPKEKVTETDSTNDFDLVLNPKTIISHNEKDGWYDNSDLDYKTIKFTVYIDGEKNDYRNIVYADRWQMVNYDETALDFEKSFMAIYSTKDYKVIEIEEKEFSSSNKKDIIDYLSTKDVNYQYDKLKIRYLYYDLNQDGVKDDAYFVSNVGIDDFTGFNKTFAFGFAKVLNQNITFYEDIANNINATNMCKPSFTTLLKVEEKTNLITECSYASNNKSKHMMYNFEDRSVNKLVETKVN